MRVRLAGDGARLAGLTLPYGHPNPGSASDSNWSSIHSSPPWEDSESPAIVRNRFADGVAVYSGLDIEAGDSPEHDALFLSLIRDLLPEPPRVEADTHPHVWLSAFDQADRITILLLNYQTDDPALPVPSAVVRVRIAEGRTCVGVRRASDAALVPHRECDSGFIEFEAGPVDDFRFYLVELEPAEHG
jgi:hypothetical protein